MSEAESDSARVTPLEEWSSVDDLPPMDEFVQGQTHYRPKNSAGLVGSEFTLASPTAPDVRLSFVDGETLERTFDGGEPVRLAHDVMEIRDGIYFVDFYDEGWPVEGAIDRYPVAVAMAFNTHTKSVTAALSYVYADAHEGLGALLKGRTEHHSYNWGGSEVIHPRSSGLVGYRIMWRYSETDHYDHVYMNRSNFAWQCVRGVEKGMTELDRCRAYEVADDLYFFHWSETQFVVETALFIDTRQVRTLGRFFGLDARDTSIMHHQFGAHGVILNRTEFPDEAGADPAQLR